MQFIKSSLVVVVFSFLWACSSSPNQLRNFIWLQGTWVANKDKVVIIETWKMQNDSTMLGTGKIVAEGDTTNFEHLALKQQRNALLYCVHLTNSADTLQFKFTSQQTDARAASFLFKSLNKTANRPFKTPCQIRYEQLLNDKMRVTLEYLSESNVIPEVFEFKQIQ